MNVRANVIDVGTDFTRFPAGRTNSDGPYSGEAFRDKHLRPWLDRHERVEIRLDSALGYGSSFLEEAFGGLIRLNYSKEDVLSLLQLDTADPLLKQEIEGYIKNASSKP